MTPEQILAAILATATPGETLMSRVPLESCDERCQKTPLCEQPKLVCAPPRRSDGVWWRPESRGEGLARFATTARAIHAVGANPPTAWIGTRRELELSLVVIARNESGFWGLVHSGELRGPLGEVCLMQLHGGLTAEQKAAVVGVDLAATTACVAEGARRFALARGACRKQKRWFRAAASHYGRGHGCHPWRLPADSRGCDSECRERLFNRLSETPRGLPSWAEGALTQPSAGT